MRYPNLLIAGAQKCGTTWLHAQLTRHPDVFLSDVKELGYFHRPNSGSDPTALQQYLAHFAAARNERYVGESTPHYFWRRTASPFSAYRDHDTAEFARATLGPEVTIVISLRDPVSRAVSGYYHNVAMGRFGRGRGIFRCPPSAGIVDLGFYKRHWEHWARVFGEDRMRLLFYDDLAVQPAYFLRRACVALDLDPAVDAWNNLDVGVRIGHRVKVGQGQRPAIKAQEVAALASLYEEDITFVEKISGRNLSAWRDVDALIQQHCSMPE